MYYIYNIRHATATSQRTQFVIITKTNRLRRYAFDWEQHTKHVNTLHGQNEAFRDATAGGAYRYHFKSNTCWTLSKKHTNPICGHQTQRWNGVGGRGAWRRTHWWAWVLCQATFVAESRSVSWCGWSPAPGLLLGVTSWQLLRQQCCLFSHCLWCWCVALTPATAWDT